MIPEMWWFGNGVQARTVKPLILRETFFSETPQAETDRDREATKTAYSGEERAGSRRAAGFRGPAKGPIGVHPANPLISGSFLAIFVCWRAKRGTSLATGPVFWEAIRKPVPPEPA